MKTLKNVNVRLTWPTSNVRPGRYASFTLTDQESGTRIAEFTMDIENFAGLMANSGGDTHDLEMVDEVGYSRLDKKMIVEQIPVPAEFLKKIDYKVREATDEMLSWSNWKLRANGGDWDSMEWRNTNAGWILLARKWVSSEEAEDKEV